MHQVTEEVQHAQVTALARNADVGSSSWVLLLMRSTKIAQRRNRIPAGPVK
jgi:hypothetical protein